LLATPWYGRDFSPTTPTRDSRDEVQEATTEAANITEEGEGSSSEEGEGSSDRPPPRAPITVGRARGKGSHYRFRNGFAEKEAAAVEEKAAAEEEGESASEEEEEGDHKWDSATTSALEPLPALSLREFRAAQREQETPPVVSWTLGSPRQVCGQEGEGEG